MHIIDIIENKKDKKTLTKEEIEFFVDQYSKNNIPDYQASALLMAIVINGMNEMEATYLTQAMINSGETIDLSDLEGVKIDKHSTGGVGDKVSLVLGPIIASCGGVFAKMSGRGLGHTGGTIDKLESIEGFSTSLSDEEFKSNLRKSKIAIIGQTDKLVPADKKLYALRDVTGCVNSIPLISSSIMSKKIATGSDVILLDVKCGSGAFMKNEKDATELAKWMIDIGKKMGKVVSAEISNMEQPLGRMIGNKNEIIEAINSLKGNGEKHFMEVIYSSAITLLLNSKLAQNKEEAKEKIDHVIKEKIALNKFYEMIKNQGGNVDLIQKENWWNPKYKHEIKAWENGYIYLNDSIELGIAAMNLGAGRKTKEDIIDNEAGIEIKKVSNEYVNQDDVIMVLYSSNPIDLNIVEDAKKVIKINENQTKIDAILAKIN